MTFLSIKVEGKVASKTLPASASAKGVQNVNGKAAEQVILVLKTGGKLAQVEKVVRAGKDIPGYAVKFLNERLPELLGRKASSGEKKAARDLLAAKLKAVDHAS